MAMGLVELLKLDLFLGDTLGVPVAAGATDTRVDFAPSPNTLRF